MEGAGNMPRSWYKSVGKKQYTNFSYKEEKRFTSYKIFDKEEIYLFKFQQRILNWHTKWLQDEKKQKESQMADGDSPIFVVEYVEKGWLSMEKRNHTDVEMVM